MMYSQLLLNILFSASIYFLVSLGINFTYSTSRFLKLSLAGYTVIAPYLVLEFYVLGLNSYFAILVTIFSVFALSAILEYYIYSKIREREIGFTVSLITSLGIYILLINIVSIFWSEETRTLSNVFFPNDFIHKNFSLTNIRIISIIAAILLFISTKIFLDYSSIGLKFLSVESNVILSKVFGIDTKKIFIVTSGVAAVLFGLSGILIGIDTNFNPNIGFNLLVYGVVVMIIGGKGSINGLLFGSILLSTLQHLAIFYFDAKWMEAIAYIVLILFLLWKPMGLSGNKLKKIEI